MTTCLHLFIIITYNKSHSTKLEYGAEDEGVSLKYGKYKTNRIDTGRIEKARR